MGLTLCCAIIDWVYGRIIGLYADLNYLKCTKHFNVGHRLLPIQVTNDFPHAKAWWLNHVDLGYNTTVRTEDFSKGYAY